MGVLSILGNGISHMWRSMQWWGRLLAIGATLLFLIWVGGKIRQAWRALSAHWRGKPLPSDDSPVGLIDIVRHVFLSFLRHHPSSVLSSSVAPRLARVHHPRATSTPSSHNVTTRPARPQRSRGEEVCQRVAEAFFGVPFRKCRPDFLRNPVTQERLELDLYNDELRLAIEFHGQQHYFFSKFYHTNSKDKFQNQQYRDFLKRDLCRQHRIHLIVVPFSMHEDDIPPFLEREFDRFRHLQHVYVPDA